MIPIPPDIYLWDFWYAFDAPTGVFDVFALCSTPAEARRNEHHFSARVCHLRTSDFETFDWHTDDVLSARDDAWFNTSIWTGDLVRAASGARRAYFTSRTGGLPGGDPFTQYVGSCRVDDHDISSWAPDLSEQIAADPRFYRTCSDLDNEGVVHAWRDPFLYRSTRGNCMLLAARARDAPPTAAGCVAWLQSPRLGAPWEAAAPAWAPHTFNEIELPHLVRREGRPHLAFSAHQSGGAAGQEDPRDGFYLIPCRLDGNGRPAVHGTPELLVPKHRSGVYGCRIIPELGGAVVGFEIATGRLKRLEPVADCDPIDRTLQT